MQARWPRWVNSGPRHTWLGLPLSWPDRCSERLRIFGRWGDGAKQAVYLAVGTSGEVERVGIGVSATAQGQRPQPIDSERLAIVGPEGAVEIPIRVECIYLPITGI